MSQLAYNFFTHKGSAGGILDLAPYEVNAFVNEEANGLMQFGMGVVGGTDPEKQVALPDTDSVPADFYGIVTNRRTTERNIDGTMDVKNKKEVGVMRWGRIYARVAEDTTVAYGDPVYLIVSGDDVGCFTNEADDAIAVNAKFIGTVENGCAPVELYNAPAASAGATSASSISLGDLADVDLTTPATNGQVLKYDGTDEKWEAGADATT